VSRRIPFGSRLASQCEASKSSARYPDAVPAACPIGWSVEPTHGHSGATSYPSRPGLLHVIQIQKES
jgi:hypothetical protein